MTAPNTTEPDVVDVLTQDHHEVLDLIGGIGASSDHDHQRDIVDTVIAELVRHSVAEEMFVYPAMAKHLEDGAERVKHDQREHKELEKTMVKLEHLDPADASFAAIVDELTEQLRHHAGDEENNQFPELRAKLPREELVELAGKVQAAKAAAPTRPHPLSPNNELFHKTVGPGVGLVDRLRDAVTGRTKNT